ncbi:UNVERIFIED_CONTAM: IclR family transcriptional regulator [Comamonas sp. A-3]|uniref:IclR family transcriptional regulator n=1 Tax=Comamonas thiooxydans TaxID=363952 RepID=A0AA42Q8U4_9BURK|nr:IclR family transcriptional regulator [Comamonas thiooxydans]MDH1336863.1 IclR family transcriptional regulator [Comamonas thiooxydans]MDH1743026.1 IclR family transcriptional regulator [Comamonas thiooxydans]MDH1789358.1 IclR family transcriptional regulator [Comamonas thiooxydans]
MIDNDMKHSEDTPSARLDGDTPNLRLFALLEAVAQKSQPFTLQTMVEETGLPKPTMHRMLAQLEGAGILQRDGNGRHYGTGQRLMRLAENVLLNNTTHGARHAVLTQLVRELGESCNITAFSGSEVLYLDRVETPAPLRFYLHPGSRVPAHCSATGKLFLSQMSPAQRRRLLANVPLEAFTGNTLTTFEALDQELDQVRAQGYAFDNEEFLPGLLCLGVLVPAPQGHSNMGLAVQAPIMRFSKEKALSFLPKLQAAVAAIARINDDVPPETDDD